MIDPKKGMQDKLAILSLHHNTNDFQVAIHLFFNGTKNAPNNVLFYIANVMLIFMFVLLIFMKKGIKEKWVSGKTLNNTLLKVIADV